MKFDSLANSLLNEMDVERIAKQDSREVYNDNMKELVDMVKSMPTDQLIGLYIEDLYDLYTGGLFDRHDSDRAKQQINTIKQELLGRGESEEKLNTIEDDIKEEIIADEEGFEER